jgi:hypothetical protein
MKNYEIFITFILIYKPGVGAGAGPKLSAPVPAKSCRFTGPGSAIMVFIIQAMTVRIFKVQQ